MAADPKNGFHFIGGLTRDPEIVGANGNVVRLSLAVDYSGSDSEDSDNRTGYFNVRFFLNGDTSNAKFVADQISKGNMKKGSQVAIVGRAVNPRYLTAGGDRRSEVEFHADAITYVGGMRRDDAEEIPEAATTAPSIF